MKEGDFLMKYGHFDDVHQEYVITTPKTPLPWINYLGCNEFFSLISVRPCRMANSAAGHDVNS